ncbi:Hypothetical protein (Fragment) [Durusdinium trenchii]|uniref:Uncharacterized protein n=1 Tax=Durusdinium trenchii TaxID=1381693 RepID=A0ABP0KK12_9DINO
MWAAARATARRSALGALSSVAERTASKAVAEQGRSFYFPRKLWLPWRVRLVRERQAALRRKRHLWPRRRDPEEEPIFGDKDQDMVSFTEKEIRMSFRKLLHYAKLMKRKQIQDAYEWVDSLSRMKSEPILKLIQKAMDEVKEKRGWDLARTYLWDPQPGFGFFVKSLRKHSRGRYGIIHSCRNRFTIRLRQMPLEEWFHWLYIYGKVPKTLSGDMRLALAQKRVSPQMQREWAPYLCSRSRFWHRQELKWLDSTRQFDYYKARQEFIDQYKANLLRESTEAREARGLAPLPMGE